MTEPAFVLIEGDTAMVCEGDVCAVPAPAPAPEEPVDEGNEPS
ncbi:hypothetical protein ACQP2E_19190 [Actinoplanes sp. CA-015351]